MKPIKPFLAPLLLVTLPLSLHAQFAFVTNSGALTLTGYSGPGGDILVPVVTNGLLVTSIGSGAFTQKPGLTGVTIPDSVTNIGAQAFINCYNLSHLAIGAGVDRIETEAFKECRDLTNLVIPSVTAIGGSAFQYCNGLTNVTFGTRLYAVGDQAFNSCLGLTSITLPGSVTNIGSRALSACEALTAITVNTSNSVYKTLDGVLFDKSQSTLIQCPGGKPGSYVVPDTVTNIQDWSFENCTSLTEVTIGNQAQNIGGNAFVFCLSLTTVIMGNGVTYLGPYAFGYCYNLANISLPNGVTNIAESAFRDCRNLTSLVIPVSVTGIGGYVFYDCYKLANITFSDNVTTIGDYEFANCSSLTSFTIGPKVTQIGLGAFAHCTGLTSLTIPGSLTNLNSQAFVGCNGLTGITVDASNPVYSSLDGVVFDKHQTTLLAFPAGQFGGYTVPNGTTTIGPMAFEMCNNLSSVTIPGSITNIAQYAFYWCSGLSAVYFEGKAPKADPTVFIRDTATIYYLPGTTGWGATFAGLPTSPWVLPNPLILNNSWGVQTHNFGFIISWGMNLPVIVEATTNLSNPVWSPLFTNGLSSGWCYFNDPPWSNFPSRFYRIRSQ